MAQRVTGTEGFLDRGPIARHARDVAGLLAGGNPQEKVEIDLGNHLIRTSTPRTSTPHSSRPTGG
ncbi:hypothetical protein ACFQVC_32220 [Streptomyces monticola]|uniref:Uncharacterized protein n=1 Tax=Streptomyces monticola TaxID=2666263 RepID=A0ABW2JTV6_9ACTN